MLGAPMLGLWAMMGMVNSASADARPAQGEERRSMGNLGPKQPLFEARRPDVGRVPVRPSVYRHQYADHGYYCPHYGGAYHDPYYYHDPYGYGNGYDPTRFCRPPYPRYYVPPLIIPAETLYGPEPIKRLMGWDRPVQPRRNVIIVPPPDDAPEAAKPDLRGTNARSIELARKFIAIGDNHFANQRFIEANSRYRTAARAAPQLADVYFRQGFALAATGRYDLAAKALKRGLQHDPGWARSGFRLAALYGENRAAKTAHVEAMAAAAEKEPGNGDLLFLVGVYLHFDGHADRSGPFFQAAAKLAAGDDAHLRGFLEKAAP